MAMAPSWLRGGRLFYGLEVNMLAIMEMHGVEHAEARSQVGIIQTLNFLDAPSHLYMRVCPSVRPYVRMSVSI